MSPIAIAAVILAVLNAVSFGLMAYDKRCAKAGKWRVPEKTLFISAGLFGGLGGVLGMLLCRHKTKHWYFVIGMPAILIAHIVMGWLAYSKGLIF